MFKLIRVETAKKTALRALNLWREANITYRRKTKSIYHIIWFFHFPLTDITFNTFIHSVLILLKEIFVGQFSRLIAQGERSIKPRHKKALFSARLFMQTILSPEKKKSNCCNHALPLVDSVCDFGNYNS